MSLEELEEKLLQKTKELNSYISETNLIIRKLDDEIRNIESKINNIKVAEIKDTVITYDHIKLLKKMEFENISYGEIVSIGVDGKRPFGNSNFIEDIMKILDWDSYEEGTDKWKEQEKKAIRLFNELPYVLNKVLKNISINEEKK